MEGPVSVANGVGGVVVGKGVTDALVDNSLLLTVRFLHDRPPTFE